MINTEQPIEPQDSDKKSEEKKPDDHSGIMFQGFLKISDPETGEIYTQGRA